MFKYTSVQFECKSKSANNVYIYIYIYIYILYDNDTDILYFSKRYDTGSSTKVVYFHN